MREDDSLQSLWGMADEGQHGYLGLLICIAVQMNGEKTDVRL